ncbi:SAM-dependent methyltransferase [Kitasatospora sp. MAP12-15]|uniref:class I SAM-dependent methyltransferase n=1 Tax=unclassified Kitasatospora TaxID=2633591 RepID=UPI002475E07F|nr:class I SAM-dependent methyltransferase [Kitasatospora sp. MAP12-44]MDH6114711.1 SAM-dependent methyltransferase [Kitasatospora sp. MAP12-44]
MTEHSYLAATRASYDTVAADYAELNRDWLAGSPLDRAVLTAFAELVQRAGDRPVADLGCGPGYLTAYLDGLGVPAFGVDLSPAMVEVARRGYPHLRFRTGSMAALDLADGELGGILAWYSTHHTPLEHLSAVFSEFHRTLAPGGHLLLGTHVGDELRQLRHAYGHPVSLESHLLPPDRVAELLGAAGLVVTSRLLKEPTGTQTRQHVSFLAHRPGAPAADAPQ